MVKVVFVFAIAMMAVAALAVPVEEHDAAPEAPAGIYQIQGVVAPGPQARVTCDLMSGLGVNDSACAAHCLLLGFRGGWCERGVCHCRR